MHVQKSNSRALKLAVAPSELTDGPGHPLDPVNVAMATPGLANSFVVSIDVRARRIA